MFIKLPIDDFLCGLNNGICNMCIDRPQAGIHACGRLFNLSKRTNKLSGEAQITNREIEHGTLRASSIISIYRYPHLTHRIAFNAGLFSLIDHVYSPV